MNTNETELSAVSHCRTTSTLDTLCTNKIWQAGVSTVPLTSNLTRSCESLASDSQLSREYVFVCARGRPGGLARTCWSAREEGLVVSRERVSLLARKGWWSRENVLVCSRGRPGGLARTCWSAREEGLVVSRVRVCLLARKGWWSRECVFVCLRGRAGGLASACLSAREEGLVVSRVRV